MAGGVVDGQAVNQAITNNAFLKRNGDDFTEGKLGLQNADAESGSNVTNVQRELNSIASFLGKALNGVKDLLPGWAAIPGFSDTDTAFERTDALSSKFHGGTGHGHSGADGDAPPIDVADLVGTQLMGRAVKGDDLSAVTGSSVDLDVELAGEVASTGDTVEGAVVETGNNRVLLFDLLGNSFVNDDGEKVYGLLHFDDDIDEWTMDFWVDDLVAGALPHSFADPVDIQWFYQRLFSETTRPVYSDDFKIPGGSGGGSGSGGGGGAAAIWQEGEGAPPPPDATVQGLALLDFSQEGDQEVWCALTVPAEYSGDQIFLKGGKLATTVTTGNIRMRCKAYLLRAGTEVLGTLPTPHDSANAELAISGSANLVRSIGDVDLTDAAGEINSVSVQPLDTILVRLYRDVASETAAAAAAARVLKNSFVPTFA